MNLVVSCPSCIRVVLGSYKVGLSEAVHCMSPEALKFLVTHVNDICLNQKLTGYMKVLRRKLKWP